MLMAEKPATRKSRQRHVRLFWVDFLRVMKQEMEDVCLIVQYGRRLIYQQLNII